MREPVTRLHSVRNVPNNKRSALRSHPHAAAACDDAANRTLGVSLALAGDLTTGGGSRLSQTCDQNRSLPVKIALPALPDSAGSVDIWWWL